MVAEPLATFSSAMYQIASVEHVMTPALAICLDAVESNIQTKLALLGGNPERWRPHVKTATLPAVMARLVACGVRHVKCAVIPELLTVCEAGASDVVVSYPCPITAMGDPRPFCQPWFAMMAVVIVNAAESNSGRQYGLCKLNDSLQMILFDAGSIHAGIHVDER